LTNPFIAPPSPWQPPEEDVGVLDTIGDVAAAPFRGAVGFAQGVYGLGDALTGDALPDWKDNPLGKSRTLLGGLAEGATQFLLGFVPIAGEAAFAGRLGAVGEFLAEGGALGKLGWKTATGAAGL